LILGRNGSSNCRVAGFRNPWGLVELDDRTHDPQADRQRDAITNAAGYKTIRYQSKQKPTEAEIAALFHHARAWMTEYVSPRPSITEWLEHLGYSCYW